MKPRNSIWVRNNGTRPLESRYDGEDIIIPPGEYLEVEIDCAELVLGLGEENKGRAIRRLGWADTQSDMAPAIERLNSFSFHMSEDEAKGHCSSAPAVDTAKPKAKAAGKASVSKVARTPRPSGNALEKLAKVAAAAPAS